MKAHFDKTCIDCYYDKVEKEKYNGPHCNPCINFKTGTEAFSQWREIPKEPTNE